MTDITIHKVSICIKVCGQRKESLQRLINGLLSAVQQETTLCKDGEQCTVCDFWIEANTLITRCSQKPDDQQIVLPLTRNSN